MATRSFIAYKENELYYDIYCHNDGYLEYNGNLLLKYYNNLDRIKSLFELGDISYLGARLSENEPPPNDEDVNVTFSYWRDRGESMEGVQPRFHKSSDTLRIDEFNYLYNNGEWYYRTYDDQIWKELTIDMTE
jgi:hypothetical protein